MSRIVAVAWHDLRRAAGAPVGLIVMLSIPLLITAIIGLSFGGQGRSKTVRLRLLVWDRDDSFVSHLVTSAITQDRAAEFIDATFVGEEGTDLLRKGKATALLVIPPAFGDSLLAGQQARLELVKNPAERYLPVASEHGVRVLASALSALALVLDDELKTIAGISKAPELAAMRLVSNVSDGISRKLYLLGTRLSPLPLSVERRATQETDTLNIFGGVLPGLTVLMLMMVARKLLSEVTEDRENGTLATLLASPLTLVEYAAGKTAALIVIVLVGFAVLIPAGSLMFGIRWGNPLGVTMVAVAFAVATSGLMLLLAGIARSARQADSMGIMVVLVMGLAGGSMAPLRVERGVLAVIGACTPNRWAIDSFWALMEGQPLAAVGGNVAVLGASGAILLILGARCLLRKVSL